MVSGSGRYAEYLAVAGAHKPHTSDLTSKMISPDGFSCKQYYTPISEKSIVGQEEGWPRFRRHGTLCRKNLARGFESCSLPANSADQLIERLRESVDPLFLDGITALIQIYP
jgi:hypothetical protein